jgi:hypothetical protein
MSAAYPTSNVGWPVGRPRSPSGNSAETLVLIALILQVIGGVILLGAIAFLFGFSVLHPFPYAGFAVAAALVVGALVVVFLYFAYTLSYHRIQMGEYDAARTPTLVIGILSLFFGLLPGIFYLIGYVKLDSAIREQQGANPGALGFAPGFAPGAQVSCKGCGRVYPVGMYAFCPACGQKMGA